MFTLTKTSHWHKEIDLYQLKKVAVKQPFLIVF